MINSFDNSSHCQQQSQNNKTNRQPTPDRLERLHKNDKKHLDNKLESLQNPQLSPLQFQPQKQNLMETIKKSSNEQKVQSYSDQKNTRGIYYRVNMKEMDNKLKQKRLLTNSPNKSNYEQSLKQSIETYANDNDYLSSEQRMYLQKLLKQEEARELINSNSNPNIGPTSGEKTKPINHRLLKLSPQKQKGELLNKSISYTTQGPIAPPNNYINGNNLNNSNSPKSYSPTSQIKTEGDLPKGEKEIQIRQENYKQLWNRLLPYLEKPRFLKSNRQYSSPIPNEMVYPLEINQNSQYQEDFQTQQNPEMSVHSQGHSNTFNNFQKINNRQLPQIHQTNQQLQQKIQMKDKLKDNYFQVDMFDHGVRQERSFIRTRNQNGVLNRTQTITPEKITLKSHSQQHQSLNQDQVSQILQMHNLQSTLKDNYKSPNNRLYSNSLQRNMQTSVVDNEIDIVKQYKECSELLSLVQVNLSNIVSNMGNKKTPKGDFLSRKIQPISSNKSDQFSQTIIYDGKVRKKGLEKIALPSLYITRNSPTKELQTSPQKEKKERSSSFQRQDEQISQINDKYNSNTFSNKVHGLEKQQNQTVQTIDNIEYSQEFENQASMTKSNTFQQQPLKNDKQSNIQKNSIQTPIQDQPNLKTEDLNQTIQQSQELKVIEKEPLQLEQSFDQDPKLCCNCNSQISSKVNLIQKNENSSEQQREENKQLKNKDLSQKSLTKNSNDDQIKKEEQEVEQFEQTPNTLGEENQQQQTQEQEKIDINSQDQPNQQIINQNLEESKQTQQNNNEEVQQNIILEQNNIQDQVIESKSQVIEINIEQVEKSASVSQKPLKVEVESQNISKQVSPSSKSQQDSQLSKKNSSQVKSRVGSSRQSKAEIKNTPDFSKNNSISPKSKDTKNVSPKTNDNEKQQQDQQDIKPSLKNSRKNSQSPPKQVEQQIENKEDSLEQQKSKELKKEFEKVLSVKAAAAAAEAELQRIRQQEEDLKRAQQEEKERMKPLFEQIKNLEKEQKKEELQDIKIEIKVNRYTGNLNCKMTFGDISNLNQQGLNLKFLKKFNQKNKIYKIERQMNVFNLPLSLLSNRSFLTDKNKYNETQFFECVDCCIETKQMENYKNSDFKEIMITQYFNEQVTKGDSRESIIIEIKQISIYHDEEFYQCDTLLVEYEKFETLDEIILDRIKNQQFFSEYELLISYLQMLNNYQLLINNKIVHQNINATKIAYSFADCKFKFMPLARAHAYNFGDFSPRETQTDKFMIKGQNDSHPVWIDLVNLGIVFCQMKLLDSAQNKSVLEKINHNDKTISRQIISMLCVNNCETTLNECIKLIYQNISAASFLNLMLQPIKHEIKTDFEKCKKMRTIAQTYESINQIKDACLIFSELAVLKETVYGKNTDEYFQGLCDELFIFYKDGQSHQLEGQYQKCQEYFKNIPSLPQSVEYIHYIAEIQWRLGKEQESEEFFNKAFQIISTSSEKIDSRYMTNIFNNKGVNELQRDGFQKAIQYFEEANKYCHQQPEINKMMLSSILNNYSITLLKMNRLEESLVNMLKSIQLKEEIEVLNSDPEGSKMAYAISMLYKQTKNDIKKSLEYLDLALKLQENHQNYVEQVKYYYKKIQYYFELDQQQNAIDIVVLILPLIEKCELATFRQIIQTSYDLGTLFRNKQLKEQALSFFSAAYNVGVKIAGPSVLAIQQIKKELDSLK